MNDDAKLVRVIRINAIGGSVMLGLLVLTGVLIVAGALPWDYGTAVQLGLLGLLPTALAFLIVWSARRDLVDPAGRERRYQQAALAFGAGVIVVGLLVVVGVIAWGLAG